MQRLVSYADELVTGIGPRPSGSNGEYEAAELIATNLESLGLDTWLQDYSTTRNTSWVRILYFMLGVIAAEILFAFPQFTFVACALALVAVVLLALDLLDFDPMFSNFATGSSQNVIARYVPEGADPRRKVVVVAHYDAGRTLVQATPMIASFFPLIQKILRGALVALAFFTVFALFPFPELVVLLLHVLGLIAGIILLLATIVEVINLFMPYSQGANCNASGVAALMGIAEVLMGARTSEHATPRKRRRSQESRRDSAADEGDRSAKTTRDRSARGATLAKVSGATGDLFSKAKGALGRKPAELEDAGEPEQSSGADYNGYGEVAEPRPLRSGLPSNRSERRGQRAPGPEGARGAAAPAAGTVEVGTADLGLDTVVAARAARSRIERGATDNPAIRVRETLAEREEQQRSLQEQIELTGARTEDGTPAWFADAKKAAKKEVDREKAAEKEPQVARSRFADSPDDYVVAAKPEPKPVWSPELDRAVAAVTAAPQPEADFVPSAVSSAASFEEPAAAAGVAAGVAVSSSAAEPEPAPEPERPPVQPEPGQKSVPYVEQPTTLNADFSGIDRLATDPTVKPPLRSRLPKSATSLEHAVATKAPEIPAHDNLRNLPTLTLSSSGAIPTQQAAFDQHSLFDAAEPVTGEKRVSNTGSFAPLGATGIMKPVGEELLQYHDDEQDIYIDDADETASWRSRENPDGEAPSLVDIPKSRTKSFFGSLGDRLSGSRKKESHSTSAATWLGVDENFDARSEGSQIGVWDNFSEEGDDDWKGGAYGGSTEENAQALATFSSTLIDREVWIVAVGAHECRNTGIKNLLAEYERELKSALVINLDSVGAGDLFFTMAEGSFLPKGTDHRLQSLVKTSADALGIAIDPAGLTSYTSDAAVALASGYRAISLVGLEDKLPVSWRCKSDRLDILEEDNLQAVCELVLEVIKSA